jgi:hypothetical protein
MPDRASFQDRITSRKFVAVMGWQSVFTVLLLADKLTGDQYVNVTTLLLVGYLVVNSAQHVLEKRE